jgi:hypothetical protein
MKARIALRKADVVWLAVSEVAEELLEIRAKQGRQRPVGVVDIIASLESSQEVEGLRKQRGQLLELCDLQLQSVT